MHGFLLAGTRRETITMEIVEDIHELVGHTPLIHLTHLDLPEGADIYAKAELLNPGGSIKDRLGAHIIEKAERDGRLVPGGTIVEITAGNTGIGLAFAALNRGYRLILIVPCCYSKEKQIVMRALGAEVVTVSSEEGLTGACEKAKELQRSIPNAYFVDQFENPDNPETYYETLGPEIYEQLDGEIDWFVTGAGSGGTFSGTAKYLKEQNHAIRTVLADPVGSIIGGGDPGHFRIEGIGNDFVAGTMDLSLVDEVTKIRDEEAFAACRALAAKEGIFAGSSSGAGLAGALQLIQRGERGKFVIVIPDRAERYFSEGLFQ